MTREGERELARRRDRGWAVGRWLALAGADAGRLLDTLIEARSPLGADAPVRAQRVLESLRHWQTVQRRCRAAVEVNDWQGARAAADQLRPAVDSLPVDAKGWLPLVTSWTRTLAEALLTDERDEAEIARIEQHLGYPRSCWAELSHAIVEGERDAKRAIDDLVEANLRLVMFVARRYRRQHMMPVVDLIQEGNLGLIQAAERFDPNRGLRFATYAMWWIRQTLSRSLSNHGRTVRIPVASIEILIKINRLRSEAPAGQPEPTAEEMAKRLGEPVSRIEFLMTVGFEPVSIDAPPFDNDVPLADLLVDTQAADPVEHISKLEHSRQLRALLGRLSSLERRVLELRFGLASTGEKSTEAIANELDLTMNRVRQLEYRALEQLRRLAARSARAARLAEIARSIGAAARS